MAQVTRLAGWVFVGGALGTLARYGVGLAIDPVGGVPLATLLVNLVGSFALGLLLGATTDERLRAGLGTGLLGGFTTYSAFAAETEQLLRDGDLMGLGYPLLTVVAGLAAAIAGLALTERRR